MDGVAGGADASVTKQTLDLRLRESQLGCHPVILSAKFGKGVAGILDLVPKSNHDIKA